MKIRKRRQPLDFGALAQQGGPPFEDEALDAEIDVGPAEGLLAPPDFDFAAAEPPEIPTEPAARVLRRTPPPPDLELDELAPEPAPELEPPLSPPPRPGARVAQAHPRTPTHRPHRTERRGEPRAAPVQAAGLPPAWPIYAVAFAVSTIWAGAPIALAWGYRREITPFQHDLFALAIFALLAAGPAVLVWVAAYLVRQGQRLAAEAGRAKALADDMVLPAVMASGEAVGLVQSVRDEIGLAGQAVREEIDRAGQAAQEARDTLMALRDALAAESGRLAEAAAASVRTATDLSQTLGKERIEMAGLAQTLDGQSVAVADAITRQARMVAEASDLAETQLREAEASLAARAADLAAAAGEAGDTARMAGEDLTRHIARLETAGAGVAEQINAVEAGLSEHRTGLTTTAHGLRADHETFAAEAETQTAKLAEFISEARLSAAEMGDRAIKGADALQQLIAEATGHFRDFAEQARAEREEFGASSAQSLQALAEAAAQERAKLEEQTRAAIAALADAAEETRAAAERHAETARAQVDQLSEAAFTAGQKANQVFEARLDEARELIERSAQMVEEAGAATVRKLDDGAAAARVTLGELERMLGEIEVRASTLPAAAREQAESVRAAVARSLEEMTEHARRTAEEAGAETSRKLDDGAVAARESLAELHRMLGEIDERTARLPTAARDQAEEVRAAVAQSMDDLLEQARRTAEETEAIDLAFQDRVRRNYEMLSEAVRLMGAVANAAPAAPTPLRERVPPRAASPARAAAAEPADEDLELDQPVSPPPAPIAAAAPKGRERPEFGLRPRLRLTPTATDEEFSSVFEAAGGRTDEPSDSGEAWTWKELLSSIDDGGPGGGGVDDDLAAEIAAMGIDPTALLPRARIEEIAAAMQAGDRAGAREVVRRLAPAGTRRLSRRLHTDGSLKERADRQLARYHALIAEASGRDRGGAALAGLLSSDAGRAFLLFDAAASDRT